MIFTKLSFKQKRVNVTVNELLHLRATKAVHNRQDVAKTQDAYLLYLQRYLKLPDVTTEAILAIKEIKLGKATKAAIAR